MKSSFDSPFTPRKTSQVEVWKPDTIFPSLVLENMDTAIDDILKIFQPEHNADQTDGGESAASTAQDTLPRQAHVKPWNLTELDVSMAPRQEQPINQAEFTGVPVRIDRNDKHALSEARRQAEELLRNARRSAEELIQQATGQAEQIRKDAYEEGRLQGIAQLEKAATSAQLIVEQISAWREKTAAESAMLVADMIKKIAHLMFDEGVVLSNEALQRNLNRVMKMAQSMGDLRVYLNPKDLMNLDSEWRRFQETLLDKKIQIIPSDSILPGGCYVQGEMGVVDAQVETQMAAIMEAFDPDPDKIEEEPV